MTPPPLSDESPDATGPIAAINIPPSRGSSISIDPSTLKLVLAVAAIVLGTSGTSYLGTQTGDDEATHAILSEVQEVKLGVQGMRRDLEDVSDSVELLGEVSDDATRDIERLRQFAIEASADPDEAAKALKRPEKQPSWKDRKRRLKRRR